MANMLIVRPLTVGSVAASRGTGAANLLTPDPKEVWRDTTPDSTQVSLTIDMGADVAFDTVALVGTNGWGNITVDVFYSTAAQGATYASTFYALGTPASQAPQAPLTLLMHRAAGTVTGRYIRVRVAQQTGASALYAGGLVVGAAFKPTYNMEWGSGRGLIDTGTKQRLRGGGFGITRGAKVPTYQWTLGDLTDSEVGTLYDLIAKVGETDPVLVVEDPAATSGLDRGIHYGLLNRLDTYERQDPNLNRWSLSMERWL